MNIELINKTKKYKLKEKNIVYFIDTVLEELGIKGAELSITLTTDKYIKRLNKQTFNRNNPTDVISFPQYKQGEKRYNDLLGDIVISLDRTAEQGVEYNTGFDRELELLIVHGILHLLGYDHKENEYETSKMAEYANYILNKKGGRLKYYVK